MPLVLLLWAVLPVLASDPVPATADEAVSLLEVQAADLQRQIDELHPLRSRLESLLKRYEEGTPLPEDEAARGPLREEVAARSLKMKSDRESYYLLRDRLQTVSLVKGLYTLRTSQPGTNVLPSLSKPLQHLASGSRHDKLQKEADDLRIAVDRILLKEAKVFETYQERRNMRRRVLFGSAAALVLLAAGAAARWALKG